MPSLSHVPERVRSGGQREPGDRWSRNRAGSDTVHDLAQVAPDVARIHTGQLGPVDDGVGHVRPAPSDLGGVEDPALADLDEASVVRHDREARVDRRAAQRVQHEVHAAAGGRGHDPLAEVERSRVEYVRHSLLLQERTLLGAPRGRQHSSADSAGQHDAREADTAGPRVDQHPFPGLHTAHRRQRVGGGYVRHR